jgi:hypothetical protein
MGGFKHYIFFQNPPYGGQGGIITKKNPVNAGLFFV